MHWAYSKIVAPNIAPQETDSNVRSTQSNPQALRSLTPEPDPPMDFIYSEPQSVETEYPLLQRSIWSFESTDKTPQPITRVSKAVPFDDNFQTFFIMNNYRLPVPSNISPDVQNQESQQKSKQTVPQVVDFENIELQLECDWSAIGVQFQLIGRTPPKNDVKRGLTIKSKAH